MKNGELVSLNNESIEFEIVCCRTNKYALTIFINRAGYIVDFFERYDEAVTTFLNISDDFANGMSELYCRKGRFNMNEL